MKKMRLLTLLLIFVIGVKAEPPSLSFANLIPNIISNGRFIQENFIDTSIEFNQTFPWINLDLSLSANESNCTQDIQTLIRALTTKQKWAIKSNC